MFDLTLAKEWRRAQRNQLPLSLIMLDIDHFKLYNDHYGHRRGDECLQKIGLALSGVSKRAGDLVARYGGEEFVVLLPETNESLALRLAEQCSAAVIQLQIPNRPSTIRDTITVSVGVSSIVPPIGTQSWLLVETADKLLYQAKKKGRDRIEPQ